MALQGTKLALHSPFTHADARDWQIIEQAQMRSVKLFNDSYTSVDRMTWFYTKLPNAVKVMRDWEQSEQLNDMFADPVGTGKRHAQDWIDWRERGRFGQPSWKSNPHYNNANTVVLGINEPSVRGELNRAHPNYTQNMQKVGQYTIAFLDTLTSANMRGGALNLSVGFPDNTGQDTRANWDIWSSMGVEQAIKRGNHFLFLHEYFGNLGIAENLGWWVGRYRQCPWDAPIIIGEGGYDKGVYWGWQPPRGWQGNMNVESYIAKLRELDTYCKADPRIHSVQLYTYDYANNQWESFSIRAMREQFLNYVNSVKTVPDSNTVTVFPTFPTGVTNPLPPTGGNVFNVTTRFIELARVEFGTLFEDLRASLPKHPTLRFDPIDSRTMQYACFHHTATPINTTWKRIAEHHVNTNGWAGIGYHLGIRQGKVALLGDLDTQRAHVLGRNDEALGVAWVGNSDTVSVPQSDIDLMKRLVKVLDATYSTDKVLTDHASMLPNHTVCPGSDLKRIVPTLRTPVEPSQVVLDKVAYFLEDASRRALQIGQSEGATWAQEVSDIINNKYAEMARQERDK